MGTQITISLWTADESKALPAIDAAFTEFDRLEGLLTVWRETSDVARVNAQAGKQPVPVARETIELLTRALEAARLTDGKFDPTFGALSGLWKFDHDQDGSLPDAKQVERRVALVDHAHLRVDAKAGTAFLEREGMRLHLGGIGKGYAVDRAVALLRARGFGDFMLQAGGDLYVAGRHGDRSWRVGVRDPRGPKDRYFASIEIENETFSTSGDYERSFLRDGVRYHHILDPDTGQPARLCRSVTVLAADATTADWLSTGIFVLGPERGLALAERLGGIGVILVDAKNQVHISSRLRGRVKMTAQPTNAP